MALAGGVERDVGSRGVGGVDRHSRVRVVVRVALVGERDDDLNLAVGRLRGTGGIGEHRREVDGAHGGVEPRDLKRARRGIERNRAHLRGLRPVDEVAPRVGVGHRVEELEVVAEHLERDRQQHADENAHDVVRLAVSTGENGLGLGGLQGRLRERGPRRARRRALLHGGSRSTCRFAAAGNARLRYRPTCATRSVLSRVAGRRRATLARRTRGPRTRRVRTRGPRSRIARGSGARACTRRRRALLPARAAPSMIRLPIFLIFACELLELGRGMARLERIVSLIVVSHAPKYKRDAAQCAHFHRAPTSSLILLMPCGCFQSGGEGAPAPPRHACRTFAGKFGGTWFGGLLSRAFELGLQERMQTPNPPAAKARRGISPAW